MPGKAKLATPTGGSDRAPSPVANSAASTSSGGTSARRFVFNIAVVGLSGPAAVVGVGKSCLCNRFVRPLEDSYYTDHSSTLSQVDFASRVVNNDHWLFWGERVLTAEDGVELVFRVVEQTEFVDDESFQPLKSVSAKHSYVSRCSATRLSSPGKHMYICKNQLALEDEFEQMQVPDAGRLNIDGFLCVYDVARSPDVQQEIVTQIIAHISKAKRPVVVATTKNDETREQRSIGKWLPPSVSVVVETSAHENVNVEAAFVAIAQLVDRSNVRVPKPRPYAEAARARAEIVEVARAAYVRTVMEVMRDDHRLTWALFVRRIASGGNDADFVHFCELQGRTQAQKLFKQYQREARDRIVERTLLEHVQRLPDAFEHLLTETSLVENRSWELIVALLPTLPNYERYFSPPGTLAEAISDSVVDVGADQRIAAEVLLTVAAEECFRQYVTALRVERERGRMLREFEEFLSGCAQVTPGKPLSDARIFFAGSECFEALGDADVQLVYDQHQRRLVKKAKRDFCELLLENVELFVSRLLFDPHAKGPSAVVPALDERDMHAIHERLQEDFRYRQLNRLHYARDNAICQYIGFISYPLRQHCFAQPRCVDALVETLLASALLLTTNGHGKLNEFRVAVFGGENLPRLLEDEIQRGFANLQRRCNSDDPALSVRWRVCAYSAEASSIMAVSAQGIICAFSSRATFDTIRDALEQRVFQQRNETDQTCSSGMHEQPTVPTVLLLVCDPTHLPDLPYLQQQGSSLAQRLSCPFVGVSSSSSPSSVSAGESGHYQQSQQLHCLLSEHQLSRLFECLISQQRFRVLPPSLPPMEGPPGQDVELSFADADLLRILICFMCGDEFPPSLVLNAFLQHGTVDEIASHRTTTKRAGPHMRTFVTRPIYLPQSSAKVRLEIAATAYHTAFVWLASNIFHAGYVLVYSARRRASLAHLSALIQQIPEPIPILIMVVGEVAEFFSDLSTNQLITEGNEIADRCRARFVTASMASDLQLSTLMPFFEDVWAHRTHVREALTAAALVPFNDELAISVGEQSFDEDFRPSGTLNSSGAEELSEATLSDILDQEEEPSRGPTTTFRSTSQQHLLFSPHVAPTGGLLRASGRRSGSETIWPLKSNASGEHSYNEGEGRRFPPAPAHRVDASWLTSSATASAHAAEHAPPGKLNLAEFSNVSAAIAKLLDVESGASRTHSRAQPDLTSGHSLSSIGGGKRPSSSADSGRRSASPFTVPASTSPAPLATPEAFELGVEYMTVKDALKMADNSSFVRRYANHNAEVRFSVGGATAYEKAGRKPTPHKRTTKRAATAPANKTGAAAFVVIGEPHDGQKVNACEQCEEPPPVPPYSRERLFLANARPAGEQSQGPVKAMAQVSKSPNKGADAERKSKKSVTSSIGPFGAASSHARKKTSVTSSESLPPAAATVRNLADLCAPTSGAADGVPLFVRKCVDYIEREGLNLEGLYRVPGNQLHVALLEQRFNEDPAVQFESLDIQLNAVATALKNFFATLAEPLLPAALYDRIVKIMSNDDREWRVVCIREMIDADVPRLNRQVLRFFLAHLRRVASHAFENQMDSRNLAKCFWPTLLRPHFISFESMIQMTQTFENFVFALLDDFDSIFGAR